jgi:hypothetical protein
MHVGITYIISNRDCDMQYTGGVELLRRVLPKNVKHVPGQKWWTHENATSANPFNYNWLTTPTVLQVHHQSSPCDQKCHYQENYHPPLPTLSQHHVKNGLNEMNIVGIVQNYLQCQSIMILRTFCPIRLADIKFLSPIKKYAPLEAIASWADRKPKPNHTFIDKDGPQIKQEWIKEFQDWVGKKTVISPAGIPTAIKYPLIPDKTTIGMPSRRLWWFQGMHSMPLG